MTDKSPDTRLADVSALASGGNVFNLEPTGAPVLRGVTSWAFGASVEQDVDGISAGLRGGGIGGLCSRFDQQECRLRHAAAHFSQTIGRGVFRPPGRI